MPDSPRVAIVDYGAGNLFSVQMACARVGLQGEITSRAADVFGADAVILPGVGAFGDAMARLTRLDLIPVLRDIAEQGKPFLGICLGMQLVMSESEEFGTHRGLDLVPGRVVSLRRSVSQQAKIPQVGWNRIRGAAERWSTPLLQGVEDGAYMYFVHSYIVEPESLSMVVSRSEYEGSEFCSTMVHKNVFGCQYHPERSGPAGLKIYQNFAERLTGSAA